MKRGTHRYVSGWDDSPTEPPDPNPRAAWFLVAAVLLVILSLTALRPLVGACLRWWMQ